MSVRQRYRWIKVNHRIQDGGVVKGWTEYWCGKCHKSVGIATLTRCPSCGAKHIPMPIPEGIDVMKIIGDKE